MTPHERETPWDVVFGSTRFDETRFEQVRTQDEPEAPAPPELLMRPAAGELLRELLPETASTQHAEAAAQAGALLFHGYRFWRHGRRVFRFDESAARALLTGAPPADDWRFSAPAPAGYVQLPRNLLWGRVAEDAAPEPLDGFFWSAPGTASRRERLDLLLAFGVRAGRPGLSLVAIAVETLAGVEQWARAQARPDGVDFENVLPGGELQDYHALTTRAEALKLAMLCFRRLDALPADTAPAGHEADRVVVVEDG